ncbi:MAG: hydroxylamine reductase [Pseudomonadota bacterium]
MFCYQCEQTMNGKGCTIQGVCGKTPEVSECIDHTMFAVKKLIKDAPDNTTELSHSILEALFTTVTNVNFDPQRYSDLIERLGVKIDENDPLLRVDERIKKFGEDVTGLQELLAYGLKGMAAYADHAKILGQEDDAVYDFFFDALKFLATYPTDQNKLIEMIFKCGEMNLKVMELLDKGNTSTYGHPEPTKVRITPVKGKAILVSGHDLKDLHKLLEMTKDKGINIYTHGEMLPCNAYPELKKYKHLIGNYGGAWQNQQKEFPEFPGAILMTTNCIQAPRPSYKDRIFTTGLVGWPGVVHISDKDFAPVIEAALNMDGFKNDEPEKFITVGFGHNAVMNVADKVIDAVKAKKIRHFFLIGGCDGAKPGRNYYTEFASKVPKDCVILTLACGKYRFNKMEFGDIDGIPRLLDMGQCNDAYSAIQVAIALAKAFNTDVNSLPLSFILSWYEQKAVVILLTLLHLGIKNIRIGPSLPAFITPPVLKVLIDKFNLTPITTPDEDLKGVFNEIM